MARFEGQHPDRPPISADQGRQDHLTHPKTEKGIRRIALSSDALEMLEEQRRKQNEQKALLGPGWPETDLIFTASVGTRAHEKAGVTHVRPHDLRHFHASLAIDGGMNAKMLADRLGHAHASFTLDTYSHLFEERRTPSAVSILGLVPSDGAVNDVARVRSGTDLFRNGTSAS